MELAREDGLSNATIITAALTTPVIQERVVFLRPTTAPVMMEINARQVMCVRMGFDFV